MQGTKKPLDITRNDSGNKQTFATFYDLYMDDLDMCFNNNPQKDSTLLWLPDSNKNEVTTHHGFLKHIPVLNSKEIKKSNRRSMDFQRDSRGSVRSRELKKSSRKNSLTKISGKVMKDSPKEPIKDSSPDSSIESIDSPAPKAISQTFGAFHAPRVSHAEQSETAEGGVGRESPRKDVYVKLSRDTGLSKKVSNPDNNQAQVSTHTLQTSPKSCLFEYTCLINSEYYVITYDKNDHNKNTMYWIFFHDNNSMSIKPCVKRSFDLVVTEGYRSKFLHYDETDNSVQLKNNYHDYPNAKLFTVYIKEWAMDKYKVHPIYVKCDNQCSNYEFVMIYPKIFEYVLQNRDDDSTSLA